MAHREPAATPRRTTAQRRAGPFMVAAVLSLLVGLWAGLARIGWSLPASGADLMLRHGGLMVVGFAGTVIAVERAVAIGHPLGFLAPALSGASGLALLAGAPAAVPPSLAVAAAIAYTANLGAVTLHHRQAPSILLSAGGLCLVVAALVWWEAGGFRRVVPWWMAFLVLTVAAERLEIIRFQRFSRLAILHGVGTLILLVVGPAAAQVDEGLGTRLLGAGLLGAPLWLLPRDIARRNIRSEGVARFAAAGVLASYAWLAAAGVLLLAGGLSSGVRYDAAVHTFFIGFMFGAIIAHEPIIAPAVTGLRFAFTPLFYLPLVTLHGALIWRVAADLAGGGAGRRWAALMQALAILAFMAVSAGSVLAGRDTRGRGQPPR